MSQKQQTKSTNMYSQGLKGKGKGNNNNHSGGQSQGDTNGGGGGGFVTKTDSSRVNTHTGKTIRTQEIKQKTVFKTVLDSPYNVRWQVSFLKLT